MEIKIDKTCTNLLEKAIGLMFSKPKNALFKLNPNKKQTIHSWFVFYPITLLYLNKEKELIEKHKLKPFSYYTPKNKAKYLIETPKKVNIEKGEKITIT